MNTVDLALAFLLAIGALRGYWRGFFRESFGLLAVVGELENLHGKSMAAGAESSKSSAEFLQAVNLSLKEGS